jgi:hypothetical protein
MHQGSYLQSKRIGCSSANIVTASKEQRRIRDSTSLERKQAVEEFEIVSLHPYRNGHRYYENRADRKRMNDSPILAGDHDISLLIEDHDHRNHGCDDLTVSLAMNQ